MNPAERARYRWHEAVRRIIHDQRKATGRHVTPSDCSKFAHVLLSRAVSKSARKLRDMTITGEHHINKAHNAFVRCIQFSPEGQYLVTSSWDSRSFLFRIDTLVLCERVLDHPHGTGYVHQVNWSPDGKKLLMRSTQSLIVWELRGNETSDGFCQHTGIFTHKPDAMIHGAGWNGDGSKLISLQDRQVFIMDTSGQILIDYSTQHLELHSVCVTSDSHWMICVGKYKKDHQRIGKRYGIIVWNLQRRELDKHVPVFYEINDVALASDDKSILVSYANRSPSQLWQLWTNGSSVDLTLQHSYLPKDSTPFAAIPSIFGGEHDHLVLRVTTVGDIFVWERHSAIILHCIRAPPTLRGCITSFAWNRGSANYMFATGTHDGTIHIWTERQDNDQEDLDDQAQHRVPQAFYTSQLTSGPLR
ncbi:quinon protein alcohol dehydrogenase-like superfamily [Irpex lacteus]|nr:quinon protein alcohol dehydrogenase-like superfamily [Irpex lacteus]